MSNFYDTTIEKIIDEETTISKTLRISFLGESLTISDLQVDADGNTTVIPAVIQPWKYLPDGTREKFADQEDAFAWFESVKDTFI